MKGIPSYVKENVDMEQVESDWLAYEEMLREEKEEERKKKRSKSVYRKHRKALK